MKNSSPYFVTSFYLFTPISDVKLLKKELQGMAQRHSIKGLVILAREGINATLSCASKDSMKRVQESLQRRWSQGQLLFKNSVSHRLPFSRFSVKVRSEIVSLKSKPFPSVTKTNQNTQGYLSPKKWHEKLYGHGNIKDKPVVLDVRNWYESRLGTFKGALITQLHRFSQISTFLKNKALPKDKEICLFCTGGIRCEKAILELQQQGYKKCYQLHGGILAYLEAYPHQGFEGECFVFDRRVSVQQNLQASEIYQLCPHCGQPAHQKITCEYCGEKQGRLCLECSQVPVLKETCSKNCAYHYYAQNRKQKAESRKRKTKIKNQKSK